MRKIYLETLACGTVVCLFYTLIWWLLGSRFFGLDNGILIGIVIVMAIADIGAIHYLIRRRHKSSREDSDML